MHQHVVALESCRPPRRRDSVSFVIMPPLRNDRKHGRPSGKPTPSTKRAGWVPCLPYENSGAPAQSGLALDYPNEPMWRAETGAFSAIGWDHLVRDLA